MAFLRASVGLTGCCFRRLISTGARGPACPWPTPVPRQGQRLGQPLPPASGAMTTSASMFSRSRMVHSQKDKREYPFDVIEESLWPGYFKDDASWGFVMYRCSYTDDDAWQRMVREIQDLPSLDPENPEGPRQARMQSRHNLVLMDDKAQFDGATSHEIRDHFSAWVAEELPKRVRETEELDCDAIRRNDTSEESWPDLLRYGSRYNYCLFVDDICLESLDHMGSPVVKILARDFGHLELEKRGYTIHPLYEDGQTEDYSEDVGWMYMEAVQYTFLYGYFLDDQTAWDDEYARPPYMMYQHKDTDRNPGYWRRKATCSPTLVADASTDVGL